MEIADALCLPDVYDCTTAPRNGLRFGLLSAGYYYKNFEDAPKLKDVEKSAADPSKTARGFLTACE